MRVIVNFKNTNNNNNGTITFWNLVTFNYIIISRNLNSLNSLYSDIWATTAETSTFTPGNNAIDTIGAAYTQPAPANPTCTIYQDPNYVFTTNCQSNQLSSDNPAGGQQIIHAYIMGFKFNPNKTTTSFLGVGVFNTVDPPTAGTAENTWFVDINAAPSAANPVGPRVVI
jgi:hypothetical protein